MQPYEEVAVTFARALVDGDFLRAHELLAPDLRDALSPTALREELRAMYDGYAEGPPTQIQYDEQFSMTDWLAKKPGDVGWKGPIGPRENCVHPGAGIAATVKEI